MSCFGHTRIYIYLFSNIYFFFLYHVFIIYSNTYSNWQNINETNMLPFQQIRIEIIGIWKNIIQKNFLYLFPKNSQLVLFAKEFWRIDIFLIWMT